VSPKSDRAGGVTLGVGVEGNPPQDPARGEISAEQGVRGKGDHLPNPASVAVMSEE
jgi:hypothetical protein